MANSFIQLAKISFHLKKRTSTNRKLLVRTLLDEVSSEIPTPARKSIFNHWSKPPATIGFIDHVIPGFKTRTAGQVRDRGRLIIFRHDLLLQLPQNLAKALIAHEFAHVYVCSNPAELQRIKRMAEICRQREQVR